MSITPNEMTINPTINVGVDLICFILNIRLLNQGAK